MVSAREKALFVLYDIEYNGAYSNIALKKALSPEMSKQDRALVTQLTYGVVRYKLTLDYIISGYSKVKLKKLSRYVLLILRMGVYQLYYTDKIPDSAAVNESVKLAKRYAYKSAGFVNGVLHSVISGRDTLEFPSDRIKYMSVKYSFPEEIVEIFSENEFCGDLLQSLNLEPKMTLRLNTLKGSELNIDGVQLEKSPLYEYAYYAPGFDIAASKEYRDGKFIAQDVAAMLASAALNPGKNELCIDVCAAPGGKTTHLAELMENQGRIVAFDIHEHKTELIRKNAERMGISIIETECRDASDLKEELADKADKVLADVPCSGLGIIARKPDIKWNKEDIDALPVLQYKILETAAKYLKPGGELVYSTCTLNRHENEDVVCEFIRANPEFEFSEVILPGPLMRRNHGYITLYPKIDTTDGFFISKIKRYS
ncbi:MAG: 16S rRNA (cytosine(967)-C(5))-methyltransferase RsmB [Clostridiales bacterium]|nr:16S rRNA (cytosine(967)-C(5))-methyltransferase RsmB [Clostridiales bacterium]